MGSWEVRLTWLDCNQRSYIWIFGWTLREDVRLACAQTPELSFDLHLPFQLLAKEQKNNVCKYIPAIHRRFLSWFFLREGGRLYTGYIGARSAKLQRTLSPWPMKLLWRSSLAFLQIIARLIFSGVSGIRQPSLPSLQIPVGWMYLALFLWRESCIFASFHFHESCTFAWG